MKIIVGLGNPGRRYQNTRHNLGFRTADLIAATVGARFDQEKHQGLIAEAAHAGQRLLLVKPQTYMNASGDCVADVVRRRIHDLGDLLVLSDDVNLPLGKIRLRPAGSDGGHKGLKSIIERLGANEFPRMRMGVGREKPGDSLVDHVLSRFTPEEQPIVAEMIERAARAALCWVEAGIAQAINQLSA